MNIKEAKEEVIHTVQAYLRRDETGALEIPVEKQRPILLIGPPGIGKTAIMEQIAQEMQINLVSYTITHHTRQSAIGLPFIVKRNYGGKEYSVTEYTMSEIIASIYEQIEKFGIREGILFLDEINCVSETLAPTMLQFLQYKTFGAHKVPEGFVVVTAGNPPQYNKSVRDFDIVTLDRVKRIYVTEDYNVWKEYAYKARIHGSIMAYLEIRKDHFYSIRQEIEEKSFVTARGWEDLSRILTVYEEMEVPITADLVRQYLQDDEIARDFAVYYELYNKYRRIYRIPEILEGQIPEDTKTIRDAPFDEKLSLISLLIDSLNTQFRRYEDDEQMEEILFGSMKRLRNSLKEQSAWKRELESGETPQDRVNEDILKKEESAAGQQESRNSAAALLLEQQIKEEKRELENRANAGLTAKSGERASRRALKAEEELLRQLRLNPGKEEREDFARIRDWFAKREEKRMQEADQTGEHLTNAFSFLSSVYGESQEMVIFLSELTAGSSSLKFVQEHGNDAYYRYNKLLLLKDRKSEMQDKVKKMLQL